MALEMKVYKEIAGYEAKAMFGRTWRQLAALAFMLFVGGGLFAGITFVLLGVGQTLDQATNIAMYAIFPVLIPAAAWGWWRPKGLKPEQFLGFLLRYQLMKRHIRYEDTYRPEPDADARGESLPGGAARKPAERARDRRRAARAARQLRKAITEHPQGEEARRQARRAAWRPKARPRPSSGD